MSPSAAAESPWANRLRRTYRAYRYSPFCPGHGLMRRIFRALIARHQRIRLRNGLVLEVDLASEVQQTIFWVDGDYEPQLEWVIRELMPFGTACVDCGANAGYVGLLARRFRQAPVWFVEPHPRLVETIRRNLQLNQWEADCRVVAAAASDHSGQATLYEHADKDGSHSLLPGWSEGSGTAGCAELTVPVGTLPELLGDSPQLKNIGLLKVDAEGHDLAVLKGLGPWLNPKRIRMIYAELGSERAAGISLLTRAGYAGFGQPPLNSRERRRLLRKSYEGHPIAPFAPLGDCGSAESETLWLPRESAEARHLAELATRGRDGLIGG